KVTLTRIDKSTLRIYGIGKGYEDKVLSALRWLDLIDDKGEVTEKLKGLRVVGEEFRVRLQKVATDAYADLIAVTPPESSTREKLVNYFINKHSYPHARAVISAVFVVNLWKLAGLPLSQDLTQERERTATTKDKSKGNRPSKQASQKVQKIQQIAPQPPAQDNMMLMLVEGRRHDFNLQSPIDKVIFEALSKELLKNWGKKETNESNNAEGGEQDP
ncbi:MAG: DUF5343 domain-containing protein, partial [Candidatus Micrarchaeota archaeon]|nr:DUF5343 domain-containing protein [Candidatus Micrarchaeota archaeon]